MIKEKIKEKLVDFVVILFIIFFVGTIFLLLPFSIVRESYIGVDYDNVCKYHYGEDYIYVQDKDFGTYCIELIHENLTKVNPKPFDWEYEEIKTICGKPNVFDLTKWDSIRCHGEFAKGRVSE